MKHATSGRHSRKRHNGTGRSGKGGNSRTKVYDSNGPDVRIRGTAHQVFEKYTALAKDALATGDTILSESYLQHAEHYQRIISEWHKKTQEYERMAFDEECESNNSVRTSRAGVSGGKSALESDDLSLPSSILGEEIKPESGASRRVRVRAASGNAVLKEELEDA